MVLSDYVYILYSYREKHFCVKQEHICTSFAPSAQQHSGINRMVTTKAINQTYSTHSMREVINHDSPLMQQNSCDEGWFTGDICIWVNNRKLSLQTPTAVLIFSLYLHPSTCKNTDPAHVRRIFTAMTEILSTWLLHQEQVLNLPVCEHNCSICTAAVSTGCTLCKVTISAKVKQDVHEISLLHML